MRLTPCPYNLIAYTRVSYGKIACSTPHPPRSFHERIIAPSQPPMFVQTRRGDLRSPACRICTVLRRAITDRPYEIVGFSIALCEIRTALRQKHVREANISNREAVYRELACEFISTREAVSSPACHLERSNRVAIAQSKPKVLAPQGDRVAIGSTRSTLFAQILHECDKKSRVNTSSVTLFSRAHHCDEPTADVRSNP